MSYYKFGKSYKYRGIEIIWNEYLFYEAVVPFPFDGDRVKAVRGFTVQSVITQIDAIS